VHQFGGALFRLLHEKYDFNRLALEEDPFWGKMLIEAVREGGAEAVINLGLRYPNAFHLSTEDEIQMIGEIGKISAAKEAIWGLNQVSARRTFTTGSLKSLRTNRSGRRKSFSTQRSNLKRSFPEKRSLLY
jgi:hypothetical protein